MDYDHVKIVLATLLIISFSGCELLRLIPRTAKFPEGWSRRPIPKYDTEDWDDANHSHLEWEVRLSGHQVLAGSPPESHESIEYSLQDGRLVGYDHGEFGGALFFVWAETPDKEYKIMDGNIRDIVRLNGSLYVLEGLAHMSSRHGSMLRIDNAGGVWQATQVIDFSDATPYAFTVTPDSDLCVVTSSHLLLIKDEHIVKAIVAKVDWWGFYPNSVVIWDNNAVIGMRAGIAMVNLITEEVSWFVR
jgi:hypothetical protein